MSNDDTEQVDEAFEETYHRADLQDVMMEVELGEMVEEEERRNNVTDSVEKLRYSETITSLRRSCVSRSSTTAYSNALVKMFLWMHRVSLTEEYIGYDPLSEYWKNQLKLLPPDARKNYQVGVDKSCQ